MLILNKVKNIKLNIQSLNKNLVPGVIYSGSPLNLKVIKPRSAALIIFGVIDTTDAGLQIAPKYNYLN